ncbi:SHOCT domain-containing protein [Streptococcus castoreus]|uniref:SHOCT domain-containing protein n=1 Tax=Streptococcus castoreus TaxID=254786 RepID=UPI0003FF42E7|nr:SHOCT domain-containing protein [Streptococcus castoreus]
MTEQDFQRELTYQITMAQAKQLLSEGLISEADFQAFKAKMLEKYEPFMSQLVA